MRENQIVKLCLVTVRKFKLHKSQRYQQNQERKQKEKEEPDNSYAFARVKASHDDSPHLLKRLEENLLNLRTRLPNGLPPRREDNRQIETFEEARPPFRGLHQLSPA